MLYQSLVPAFQASRIAPIPRKSNAEAHAEYVYMYNHRVHKAWARQGLYFFIHIPTGIYRCFASRDCFKFARLRKTLKTKRQINAFLHTMYASLPSGFRWCSNRCGKRYGCKGKANIWKGECFPAFCRGKLARMPV